MFVCVSVAVLLPLHGCTEASALTAALCYAVAALSLLLALTAAALGWVH
jgi:hypothetical protein